MAKVHPEMYFNADTEVTALAFSLDNKQLVAGTSHGAVQVWDLKSQKLLKTVSVFDRSQPILWLGQLSECAIIVHARFSPELKICSAQQLVVSQTLRIPAAVNHFCRGDIRDRKIAVATGDSNLAVFDDLKIKVLDCISEKKDGNLGSLRILNDGLIGLGFESGELKIVNIDDEQMVASISVTHSILSIDFDSDKLVLGNSDSFIAVLAFKDGILEVLTKREFPGKGISALAIRSDRKILVSGCWDGTVRIFSWLKPQSLKPLGALKFHEKAVESVACSPSNLIAAGSTDGYISIWKIY